jgi:hypothetical protein
MKEIHVFFAGYLIDVPGIFYTLPDISFKKVGKSISFRQKLDHFEWNAHS